MRISDWSSDVCSSDLTRIETQLQKRTQEELVLLKTIAATPSNHQLVEDGGGIKADPPPQRNVEIFEGNGPTVSALHRHKPLLIRAGRLFKAYAAQIGLNIPHTGEFTLVTEIGSAPD